jgi:class 3 adenylate cyclase
VVDIAEFEAAGLYDPADPNAQDRLALLRRLAEKGLTLDDMVAADHRGALHAAATDVRLRPGPAVSAETIADEVGISAELLRRVTLAAGVPVADDDYRQEDAEIFQIFHGGVEMFGEQSMLQFTRAVGSAMGRVADAALALFLVTIEGPLRDEGAGSAPLAEATDRAVDALAAIPPVMAGLFRLHFQAAIARQRIATRASAVPGLFQLAVGFVDLVGYTPYTQDLDPAALADFVESFELRSNEIVAARRGRVVKHIGDEVMFVVTDAAGACDVALDLIEDFADDAVAPHAGIAFGPVVARGGDYYGSVVNRASRVADIAVPGEVLVSDAVHGEVADRSGRAFAAAGRRMLKGFDEPVTLWSVTRSSPVP